MMLPEARLRPHLLGWGASHGGTLVLAASWQSARLSAAAGVALFLSLREMRDVLGDARACAGSAAGVPQLRAQ